ncbi:hypothetical protein [Brachyspira pilosicoli]|uniref:hypothetical protein n=1 Tax=Brachyspira pilosicoli TaxID=52584 RepID=UPI0002F496F7|nr:hypothetical protein [Brachyspira pilosicoli]
MSVGLLLSVFPLLSEVPPFSVDVSTLPNSVFSFTPWLLFGLLLLFEHEIINAITINISRGILLFIFYP